MAKTDSINTAIPPDTGRSPALGAGDIRTFKKAILELLAVMHYLGVSPPYDNVNITEDDAGELLKAIFRATTKPSSEAAKYKVYAKDVGSGVIELFGEDAAGNEVQFTTAGTTRLRSSDYTLANNTALKAMNASGDSTIDMMKVGTDNIPVVADGCGAVAATVNADPDLTLVTLGFLKSFDFFGDWTSKDSENNDLDSDTVYQATSAGIIIGRSDMIYNTTASFTLYTGETNGTPLWTYAKARSAFSVSQNEINAGITVPVIMPVKRNHFWEARASGTSGLNWLYFLPFNSTGQCVKQA